MQSGDLLAYTSKLKITNQDLKSFVYDEIRQKQIILLPEELVRQCVVHYLRDQIGVSKNLIRIEKGIRVNGLFRRCDIIVYDRNALPLLVVECKQPNQKLTQKAFNQIAMYNIPLRVPYLMVTNGANTYSCKIDIEAGTYEFLETIPSFPEMLKKM